MTALATAFVEAKLDTSGFGSDIKRGMSHSSVSSSVKDSGKAAGKGYSSAFGSALKIGGLLAGAFAVTKGVTFFKESIAEAQEAAKVSALTANVIKATGGAAGVTAKQIGDLATTISNKTAIDDEAIQSGANLLLTFKNIHNETGKGNKIFDQATGAVTDMSVALGQDMKSGAIQLGKALNDPIKGVTALGRVGVSFTEGQKKQIDALVKSGDTMKAQKIILKELSSEFGGAAAAAATPAEKAAVAWGNFKEDVGSALLPVLGQLATWFTEKALPAVEQFAGYIKSDVVPKVKEFAGYLRDEWLPKVKELGGLLLDHLVPALQSMADFVKRNSDLILPLVVVLGATVAVVKTIAAVTKIWAAAQALLNTAFLLSPIGLIVLAVAGLAAGLVIAYKRSETFRDIVDGAFEAVKKAIGAAGDAATAFLRFFRSMAGGAIDLVGSLIDAFASFVDGVLSAFGAVVDGADSAFGWIPGIGDDIGDAKDAFHSFAEATVNNLHDVGDGLHDTADAVRGIPDPDIDTQTAKERAHSLAAYMKQQLAGIKDEAVTIGLTATSESTLDRLGAINIKAGGPISGAGTGTSDSIPAWLSNGEHVITADEVKKAGGHKVWEGLRRLAMNGSLHKVGDIGRFAGGGMVVNPNVTQTGFSSAVGTVAGKFSSLAAGISSAISSAVNTFIETMTGPARGLEFAKSQVGKPYVWGGVGPGGYDCSGFMSAIANASMGRNPYSRLGTSAGTPWPGFAGGTIGDPGFSTASTPNFGGSGIGHVWGRIAGVGVESSGGSGPHVGNTLSLGDSHASAFQHQVYDKGGILSPGYTLAYNGTGADEYVARFAKGGPVSRADRRANRQDAAQTAADAAQAAAEALKSLEKVFKHFGFGDRAAADTIKDQLRTLTGALVGVFGKDGHIVKAVQATSAALMGVAKDRDHIAAALDRSQSKLASLIIARQTLEKEIAGGFNTTVYGDGGQSTAAGLFMSARAEINDARHFKKVLQRLKAKGLAPSILKALALAGPSAITQAESLAALSPRKLNQYEDLLQQGNQIESSLGGVVGSAVYNQQIADTRKQTHKLNHELGQLNRRIEHLDEKIEHAVERALNHVRIELDGKRVDRALADHTHRRQRAGG